MNIFYIFISNFAVSIIMWLKIMQQLVKSAHSSASLHPFKNKHVFQKLANKSVLSVKGPESKTYLQGLLTNDLNCLEHKCSVIYTMMLNAKGRVLYDLFIYKPNETEEYLLECEKSRAESLLQQLSVYKLRKKVELSIASSLQVGVLLAGDVQHPSVATLMANLHKTVTDKSVFVNLSGDPRVKDWCVRVLWRADDSPAVISQLVTENTLLLDSVDSLDHYRLSRYHLGIAENSADLPPAQCLPLECNAAFLNGVSFSKGCYIGQELTARTHYTGVIRKRLMPLQFPHNVSQLESVLVNSALITAEGKPVGRVQSVYGDAGIGLLRFGELSMTQEGVDLNIVTEAVTCRTFTPSWWPSL